MLGLKYRAWLDFGCSWLDPRGAHRIPAAMMALSLDQLARARDDLISARASGARSYRDQNGEMVEYRSDREMAAALAHLDRLIAEAGGRAMPRTILVKTSKGL